MATRKNFQFLGAKDQSISSNDLQFEFDESDMWKNTNSPQETYIVLRHSEFKRLIPNSCCPKKSASSSSLSAQAPRSLPVNVPDWSKILDKEYKSDDIRGKEKVNEENRIPPHEYLARTKGASFLAHEGMGRTLKGRDLSRVRNAIWKQTGFED